MFEFRQQYPNSQNDPLQRYCQKKQCSNLVQYNKIVTAGNDPSMSSKMKYSKLVNSSRTTKLYVVDISGVKFAVNSSGKQIKTPCADLQPKTLVKPCTNPIFNGNTIGQVPNGCSCNSSI